MFTIWCFQQSTNTKRGDFIKPIVQVFLAVLPFGAQDVAFGAPCSGFVRRRDEELSVFYGVVRGAHTLAAGAKIEVAAIGSATGCDRPANSLGLAAAGVV